MFYRYKTTRFLKSFGALNPPSLTLVCCINCKSFASFESFESFQKTFQVWWMESLNAFQKIKVVQSFTPTTRIFKALKIALACNLQLESLQDQRGKLRDGEMVPSRNDQRNA